MQCIGGILLFSLFHNIGSSSFGSSADGTQNVTVWNIQNVLPVWVFEGGKRSPRGKKFTDTVLSSLFFSITYPSHHAIDMFFLKGFLTVADFLDFKYVRTWKSFNLEGWSDHGLEMMKPLSFDYCECQVMPFLQQLVLTLIVFICRIYKFNIDNVFLAGVVKRCWGKNLFIRLVFCTSLQACFGWKHFWQMLSQLFVFKQSKNFTSVFEYKCPRLSLLIIMSISENQQN